MSELKKTKEEKFTAMKLAHLTPALIAAAYSAVLPTAAVARNIASETPMTFEARSGDTVDAFRGTLTVPENRSNPASRDLTLHYVRFPATGKNPGAPIVYLAGGPGGSGIRTAEHSRFPLFMAMRDFGDVIAFDQRGTGASRDTPECKSSTILDDTKPISDQAFMQAHRDALKECLSFWMAQGIDPRGYTTPESVADLDALRRHLGAARLSLWGISYGSHLALAAVKEMDDRLERVVIASAEGLDQTVKQPARTDQYFNHLQAAINAKTDAMPDIAAMMRRVHARLDEEPLTLTIPQGNGEPAALLFQRRDMQRLASGMIADPNRFAFQLIQLYGALDAGVSEPLADLLSQWYEPNDPISYNIMSVMMDVASGIGEERRRMIETQAQSSLLGPYLNDTLYVAEAAPAYDLGDDFRTKPEGETPLLLLSGTLDGRTYIESQREAVSELSNRQMVTVVNAGHNLFMASPAVTETIEAFMRGEKVDGREIIVDLPDF